ncbi:ATP-binding protein [Gloeocapsopsis crepidinum LEGE 06123]|uniref:ATP-binding protein n=1 Tax=Gloeocapsopsis crepidinum LEGE 06123 TaxID=588587 RepID=A0ABR9UVQ3_9CHRO|nr:ATP-binding protein [Gloeocapsopsis crepidinum]MBE9192339.1 ATP-binding protein [Gloeocapsopsis crepidinum LEGE 06123]
MSQIIGDFITCLPLNQEYLIFGFSLSYTSLQQRWRNNGISADFLANYLTTFFPDNDDGSIIAQKQTELKRAVSYIANELLENSMKFSYENSAPISIQLHLHSDRIIFVISNSISYQQFEFFQSYINILLTSDLDDLYIRQIEKSIDKEPSCSGLGLLTILNDHTTKLGWKFEEGQDNSHQVTVTTIVQLIV